MWLTCIIEQSQVKLGFGAGPSGEDHQCIKGNGWPLLQKGWPFFSQMLCNVTFNVMSKEVIFVKLKAAFTTVVLTDQTDAQQQCTLVSASPLGVSLAFMPYMRQWQIDKDFPQFSADLKVKVPFCANYTLCVKSSSFTLVCSTFQKVCVNQLFVWKL